MKEKGAELVITVDCGAAAVNALEEAESIGLPIVVIDHHLMAGHNPPAAALVNPNRPDCNSGCGHLAAAGVVFVFAAALNRLARERGIAPPEGLPDIMSFLDLAALGTLCDMSPLRGVNRAFVRQGLSILSRGQNEGLRALAEVSGISKVDSVYHATFMLGPSGCTHSMTNARPSRRRFSIRPPHRLSRRYSVIQTGVSWSPVAKAGIPA